MWVIALLPLLMILLGVGLFIGGSDERKRIRSATPAVCAQVPGGCEVKLVGRAVADGTLTSPLGQLACVYYRLVFLQYQRKPYAKGEELVVVQRVQEVANGFSIADSTGKLEIDPTGVDLRAVTGKTASSGFLGPNQVDELMAKYLLSGERTTVNELVIPAGAPLFAIGEAVAANGRTQLGGSHLLLSLLPEAELLKRDKGDLIAAVLILFGVLIGAAMVFAAIDPR